MLKFNVTEVVEFLMSFESNKEKSFKELLYATIKAERAGLLFVIPGAGEMGAVMAVEERGPDTFHIVFLAAKTGMYFKRVVSLMRVITGVKIMTALRNGKLREYPEARKILNRIMRIKD